MKVLKGFLSFLVVLQFTYADTVRVQLTKWENIRTSNSNQVLEAFAPLPPGTVIEVDSQTAARLSGVKYKRKSDNSVRTARGAYVKGVKVVSLPSNYKTLSKKIMAAQQEDSLYFYESSLKTHSRVLSGNLRTVTSELGTYRDLASNPESIPVTTEADACIGCETRTSITHQVSTLSEVVNGSSENTSSPVGDGPCDVGDSEIRRNCLKVLNSGKVPKDAFKWTMAVYKNNLGKFNTSKCFDSSSVNGNHYSVNKVKSRDLNQGIKNKCHVVINDTRKRPSTYRGTMYYIDLCKNKVVKSYFNMGTGTFRNNYADINDKKTTVLGAFLAAPQLFSFNNSSPRYRSIARKFSNLRGYGRSAKIPAVALIGLQKSNNGSVRDVKYMHVSPYYSSWGCPSISADIEARHNIIKNISEKGPSLVVNYGDKMEDPKKCSKNWK